MPYATFPQPWCHEHPHPLPCTHLPPQPPALQQGFAPAEGQMVSRALLITPKLVAFTARGVKGPPCTHVVRTAAKQGSPQSTQAHEAEQGQH